MKKASFLLLLLSLLSVRLCAQDNKYSSQRELRGSGKISREDRTVAPFQAINIRQFLSKVTVDVGGTQSTVSVEFDDNFKQFLQIETVDGVLTLDFKDPDNKPFWLGKGTLQVTVKTPSLKRLRNESNGDVVVNNLTGESFDLANQGNGNVTLRGSVMQLNVVSAANGDVKAQGLTVQKASVITQANATVEVNARQLSSQQAAHATIRNVNKTANRSVIQEVTQKPVTDELVTVILQNNSSTPRTVTLRFTEPGNSTYGVVNTTLGPYGKRRETYPVGTKIEQLDTNQQRVAMTGGKVDGTPVVTLKANDNGRIYNLPD
ncbi:GIN domain-containing protein [Spirosoma areae]